MTVIGFHASHEQIGPARLLRDVRHAEAAGFDAAMCSDHLEPWSAEQGRSGFAWSWLGAALASTSLRFGVVTAPGYRHHPTMVAQAAATLAEMFPGRFWFAPGSGEFLNEHVTGEPWPDKEARQRRLGECLEIIRRLHDGERVTHRGEITVDRARVWETPEPRPPMILPALTPGTARRFAPQVDGLVTVNQPVDELREILAAYREGGGAGKAILQVHLSWADTEEEAAATAYEQWRTNVFAPPVMADLALPEDYERRAEVERVTLADVRGAVNVSADLGRHTQWLEEYRDVGFDEIYLHYVGQDQGPFIDAFGAEVLPRLR